MCVRVGRKWEAVGVLGSDPTKQLLKISNFLRMTSCLFLSEAHLRMSYVCLVGCVYVYACIYVCTYMCTFRATDERANTCACVLDANRNPDATKKGN
jgi:hypothetical protein